MKTFSSRYWWGNGSLMLMFSLQVVGHENSRWLRELLWRFQHSLCTRHIKGLSWTAETRLYENIIKCLHKTVFWRMSDASGVVTCTVHLQNNVRRTQTHKHVHMVSIKVNRNRGTCYKQLNVRRNKSVGIPHCQVWECVCVCVRALSGWLLHATTRSCAHAAYNLLVLPPPLGSFVWYSCVIFVILPHLWTWNLVMCPPIYRTLNICRIYFSISSCSNSLKLGPCEQINPRFFNYIKSGPKYGKASVR